MDIITNTSSIMSIVVISKYCKLLAFSIAFSVIIGTRFDALSDEQSPINADLCEPIGLKYLSETLLQILFIIIFSHSCFVCPYIDSAFLNGASSLIGRKSGLPYTVHEDENIIFLTYFLSCILIQLLMILHCL